MPSIAEARYTVLAQAGGPHHVYDRLLQKTSSTHDSLESAYHRCYTLNRFGGAQ